MYRVIFEHHPKKGQEEQFIKQWQKGSDLIQTYPGALGTKLFRDIKDPDILYAIAEWESKADRDAAMEELEKREDAQEVLKGHEQYVDEVKVLASMDLIAESKPPQGIQVN